MAKKLTSSKAKEILHDKSVHGQPLTDKQRRFFGAIAGGAKPYKAESGGWLDKYDAPKAQNGIEGTMGGLTDKGFNYNGAWGGPSMQTGGNIQPAMAGANQTVPMAQLGDSVKPITMQLAMGGSIPGAVGFTYARTVGAAPSNGPYAKKTKASAQNGDEITKGKEFLTKMAKSPLFGERYATMTNRPLEQIDPKEIEDYRGRILKNLETVKIAPLDMEPEKGYFEDNPFTMGAYFREPHTIYRRKGTDQGTVTHELSHSSTALRDLLSKTPTFNYNAKLASPELVETYEQRKEYITDPTEIKARRDNVAQMMMEQGLWDPTTERFTEKHYDKLKSIEKDILKKLEKGEPYDNRILSPMGEFQDISQPYNKEETIRIFNSFVKGKDRKDTVSAAQNGKYIKDKARSIEGKLQDRFIKPDLDKAVEQANKRGIDYGEHNGPLDAIRHAASASKVASSIPIVGLPLANILGVAHEIRANRGDGKELLSDLYNNFIGSVIGSVPFISDDTRRKLVIDAQKSGILSTIDNTRREPPPLRDDMLTNESREIKERDAKLTPAKVNFENGGSMKYYQQGLDFKPKTISQDGSDIPVDPMGYWNPENVGNPVIIPSNIITMEGVDQPLLGISDEGDVQYMEPGEDYEFEGKYVTEYPVAKKGISVNMADQNPNQKLDQLLNFTNYNKPTKGGWLDKYN